MDCITYLSIPRTLVQHFKLHENLGQLVVVLDDAPGLITVQQMRALLECIHGFLDAAEHLARPADFAGDRRQVASNRRIILVTLIVLGCVLNLPPEALQNLGILFLDSQVGHIYPAIENNEKNTFSIKDS